MNYGVVIVTTCKTDYIRKTHITKDNDNITRNSLFDDWVKSKIQLITMSGKTSYYTPGVCNINPAESASRKKIAQSFLVVAILFISVSMIFSFNFYSSIITFSLVFISRLNYLQAKNNFCVMYAQAHKYSRSDKFADTEKVVEKKDSKSDLIKSRKLYIKSLLVAVIISVVHAFLLYFIN